MNFTHIKPAKKDFYKKEIGKRNAKGNFIIGQWQNGDIRKIRVNSQFYFFYIFNAKLDRWDLIQLQSINKLKGGRSYDDISSIYRFLQNTNKLQASIEKQENEDVTAIYKNELDKQAAKRKKNF